MAKQPDLFDWYPTNDAPSGAVVIPFPLARDAGRVRRVAEVLLTKRSEKAQLAYWNASICRRLAAAMARNGICDEEINRQIEAFSGAVGAEMRRLTEGSRRSPGGAK